MFKKIILLILVSLLGFSNLAQSNLNYFNAYDFEMATIAGKQIKFNEFRNKLMLVINLPAKCAFNVQYFDLEKLWERYNDKGLVIIAFTSNDFIVIGSKTKTIEAAYCNIENNFNFYISAPINITDESLMHPFYIWVKERKGSRGIPSDNYFKILIDTDGEILDYYPGNVAILGGIMEYKIKNNLPTL